MKYFFYLIGLLMLPTLSAAQTSVSGGIYSNTTWTKAASPYIVTDTIVVFPGVTLTINPGVVVKFAAGKRLEIRQGSLIALGTPADSIVFTSNTATPAAGAWGSIYLNQGTMPASFNYCRFHYAQSGIEYTSSGTMSIKNCAFSLNSSAIKGRGFGPFGTANNGTVTIDSSSFTYNTDYGMDFTTFGLPSPGGPLTSLSVNHCFVSNNGTGYSGEYKLRAASVKNSIFRNNTVGLQPQCTTIDSCIINKNQYGTNYSGRTTITNCTVDSNIYGLVSAGASLDTVRNCMIRYNSGVGYVISEYSTIYNSILENNGVQIRHRGYNYSRSIINNNLIRGGLIGLDSIPSNYIITQNVIENNTSMGIRLTDTGTIITCNKICSNGSYNLRYEGRFNIKTPFNYWCGDSTATRGKIYDGYNNISFGLVSFMPMDSTCYIVTAPPPPPPPPTTVSNTATSGMSVFPNPTSGRLDITLPAGNDLRSAEVYDLYGRRLQDAALSGNNGRIDISALPSGVYILQVSAGNTIIRRRIVRK